MRYTNSIQTCGYDPCPCRGINFISGDGKTADYCENGKRVRVIKNEPIPRSLFLYQLEKYADFLRWHQEKKESYGLGTPEPFAYIMGQAA